MDTQPSEVAVNVLCVESDSGFRCLLSLLLVDDLLTRVTRHTKASQRAPIRHVFDLVGGEGSGGIVAILVGRLGLTWDSAHDILRDMMVRFCPWGGTKRNALGIHWNKPFISNCVQSIFGRLDEQDKSSKVYYNKGSARTCVLASLEQVHQGKKFSRKLKDWAESVRAAVRVLPMKLYSRLKAGKFYSNMLFSTEKITDPTVKVGTSTSALKERFRTYDPTLSRANVYMSDVAQATFTHDNLVIPKTINGRSYASLYPGTNAILDIIDEANAVFTHRPLGVVVRIGGDHLDNLDEALTLGRTNEKGAQKKYLEGMGRTGNVFQIALPEVHYEAELMDEPEKVFVAFEKWIKLPDVQSNLEKCAEALAASVKDRAEWYPGDTVRGMW